MFIWPRISLVCFVQYITLITLIIKCQLFFLIFWEGSRSYKCACYNPYILFFVLNKKILNKTDVRRETDKCSIILDLLFKTTWSWLCQIRFEHSIQLIVRWYIAYKLTASPKGICGKYDAPKNISKQYMIILGLRNYT